MAGITSGRLSAALAALLPVALAGCQSFYPLPDDPVYNTCKIWTDPADGPTPEWALVPQQAKNHVYVYLLNGNDPLNTGNLLGVRDYLHQRGFVKTSYGQQFHGPWFEAEILAVHQADPLARFVLVGFSAAAGPTNQLARRLGEQGITVDRLVYLDGVFLFRYEEWVKPECVEKFVNVQSQGLLVRGSPREGADNVEIDGTGHFDVPSHPLTLQVLMREVTDVAKQLPVAVEVAPPLKEGPRPTPLVGGLSGKTVHHVPPEWGFLQPDLAGGAAVSISYKPASTAPRR